MNYIVSEYPEIAERILKHSHQSNGETDSVQDYLFKGMDSFKALGGKGALVSKNNEILAHMIYYPLEDDIYGIGDFWVSDGWFNQGWAKTLLSMLDSEKLIISVPFSLYSSNQLDFFQAKKVRLHPLHSDYTLLSSAFNLKKSYTKVMGVLKGDYDI